MSATAEGKKIIAEAKRIPKEVKRITYQELCPGDEFLVVREKEYPPLKIQEIWQFEVLEILSKIAMVSVIFPPSHKETAYFEEAAVGEWLK